MPQILSSAILAVLLGASSLCATFPIPHSTQTAYIVNVNTNRFHLPECKHADSIKEKNRWEYIGAREFLIYFHYIPCKVCNP